MDPEARVVEVLAALRQAIQDSGRTLVSFDRAFGKGDRSKFTSKLLAGTPELRLQVLFEYLDELGISEAEFFAGLYGFNAQDETEIDPRLVERVLEGLVNTAVEKQLREAVGKAEAQASRKPELESRK